MAEAEWAKDRYGVGVAYMKEASIGGNREALAIEGRGGERDSLDRCWLPRPGKILMTSVASSFQSPSYVGVLYTRLVELRQMSVL